LAGCFFSDGTGIFDANLIHNSTAATEKPATTTIQAATNTGHPSQWLVLVRPQGVMEVGYLLYYLKNHSYWNLDLDAAEINLGFLYHTTRYLANGYR
jgi:hypothetical protein